MLNPTHHKYYKHYKYDMFIGKKKVLIRSQSSPFDYLNVGSYFFSGEPCFCTQLHKGIFVEGGGGATD